MAKNKQEKKIILFIVEGMNDQIALGLPFENMIKQYFQDRDIKFDITGGDLTSDGKTLNIVNAIGKCINKYIDKHKLKKSKGQTQGDICEVILLVDMDGAFIPNEAIKCSEDSKKAFYDDDAILYHNPEKIIKIHERKQKYIERLLSKNKICDIPFRVYFVSCNLDHIICGNANLSEQEKRIEAEKFEQKFSGDSNGLIEFFQKPEIILSDSYEQSWTNIKQTNNSLKRYSNLNIFIAGKISNI